MAQCYGKDMRGGDPSAQTCKGVTGDQCNGNGWVKKAMWKYTDVPEGICPPWSCYNTVDKYCTVEFATCPDGYETGAAFRTCKESKPENCTGNSSTDTRGWWDTYGNLSRPDYNLGVAVCPASSCYNPITKDCAPAFIPQCGNGFTRGKGTVVSSDNTIGGNGWIETDNGSFCPPDRCFSDKFKPGQLWCIKPDSYVKTTPSKTTPSKTTPSKTTPSKTTPSKTTPSKTTPSNNKKSNVYIGILVAVVIIMLYFYLNA